MERIKEAIKLAKSQRDGGNLAVTSEVQEFAGREPVHRPARSAEPLPETPTLHANRKNLETNRIIAHRIDHPNVPSFDMLRTKVLQEMDQNDWRILVITSPTMACGKTVTATNLALSIARQPERHAVLVDLDLRKPMVAANLGVSLQWGLSDYAEGRANLEDLIFHVDIASPQLSIIANNTSLRHSSEVIVSRHIRSLFERLRSHPLRPIIVVDMPPILVSDDVIAFLPQSDCCLLAVAEGATTAREIDASVQMLGGTNYLGCVLTKSSEHAETYYY
jgi:Mrp family chromosome partitioning ATPase